MWGPDVSDTDFFSRGAVRDDGSPTQSTVTVRGTVAKLQETGHGSRDGHTLGWTERDSGQRWIATSVGMSGDELASLVGALHVGVGEVSVDGSVAPGLHSETPQPAAQIGKQVSWSVDLQPDAGLATDSDISIGVRHGDLLASLSTRAAGVELSQVDGHRSVAFTQGAVSFLEVELTPGVTARLSGPVPAGQLERLVASLQPVGPQDSRIQPLPGN